MHGPPNGGACAVGARPPSLWGVLCWCVTPALWGVLCWCLAPLLVGLLGLYLALLMAGHAELVPSPPDGWTCCVGAWPPSWWGMLCWCVAPLVLGRAVLVHGPPHGGTCGQRVRASVFVVGGLVSVAVVLVAWPGRAGRPPERVLCATPFSWPGRTRRPLERVRCATCVVVSRVWLPCRSFSLVCPPLFCVCAAVSCLLTVVAACFCPPHPHHHPWVATLMVGRAVLV